MTKPALIVNAIGLLLGLSLVGYIAYSLVHVETTAACSQRYPGATRLPLKTGDGALLSTIELQARAGLQEWGVTENTKVVAEGPAGAALQVKLAPVEAGERGGARPANGVSFHWSPAGIGQAHSACLAYSVWLPKDFPFNDGGVLPGIFGGQADAINDPPKDGSGFGTRINWRGDGVGELAAKPSGSGYALPIQRGFPLARGRWMRIEQEIVLNSPGKANGLARMWVDGDLKAENTALTLRKDKTETMFGVLADIGYLRASGTVGTLLISPFEIAWR